MSRLKKYRVYADCLMKTKIMINSPKPHYNMELDIESAFHRKEYFKSLMMASNMIESFLRRFYILSFRIKNNGKLLTNDVDVINGIPLFSIMKWANCQRIKCKKAYILPVPKKKILNNKQYNILIKLKDVRNDIAHNYYLNYDENINPTYTEKILKPISHVLHSLIKKYVKFRDNYLNLTKVPKATRKKKLTKSP